MITEDDLHSPAAAAEQSASDPRRFDQMLVLVADFCGLQGGLHRTGARSIWKELGRLIGPLPPIDGRACAPPGHARCLGRELASVRRLAQHSISPLPRRRQCEPISS
jgi:hypothetical protein